MKPTPVDWKGHRNQVLFLRVDRKTGAWSVQPIDADMARFFKGRRLTLEQARAIEKDHRQG